MSSKKRNLGDEVFDELDERACLRFEALTSLDGRVGALMRSNQLQTFQVLTQEELPVLLQESTSSATR